MTWVEVDSLAGFLMIWNTNQRVSARILMSWALVLAFAGLTGCGPSSDVMEIPADARKSVLQKKVDDQPRSAKAKKARQATAKGL